MEKGKKYFTTGITGKHGERLFQKADPLKNSILSPDFGDEKISRRQRRRSADRRRLKC